MEHNLDKMLQNNQGQVLPLTFYPPQKLLGLCSLRLVLEGKKGKDISESSRLESSKRFQQKLCLIRCKKIILWAHYREHF